MSIQMSCRSCGREYQIRDENAGRKFRCKDCGEVNIAKAAGGAAGASGSTPKRRSSAGTSAAAPRPKKRKPAPADEWQEDEYSYETYDEEDYGDEYGGSYEEEYAPPARASRGASSSKKSKKKKKSGSGAGMKIVKIVGGAVGGLFGFLMVLGVVARLFNAGVALTANVSISPQTPPGAGFQLDMPQMPVRGIQPMPGASATKWTANKRPFEFIVIKADLPALAAGVGLDVIAAGARQNSIAQGHRIVSERRTTLGGHEAVEFTMDITKPSKGRGRLRIAMIGNQMWTVLVAINGSMNLKDELCEQYFNSFKLTADAAPATTMSSTPHAEQVVDPGQFEVRLDLVCGESVEHVQQHETVILSGEQLFVDRVKRPGVVA